MLVRDFIKDSLYNKTQGYNRNKKVGVLEKPLDFGSLWGKWEYNKTIKSVYEVKTLSFRDSVEAGSELHECR